MAGVAVALAVWNEYAACAADGRNGNVPHGGGHAPATGGGSFSRPAPAPAPAVARPSGVGVRLPARPNFSPPPAVRNEPVHVAAPPVVQRSSVPAFVAPVRIPQPRVAAPAAVPPQPFRPAAEPQRTARETGEGFIRLPRGGGAAAPSVAVQPHAEVRPGAVATPRLTRGLGTAAGAAAGIGAMQGVREYLQKRGQNLQTWSGSRVEGFERLHQANAPRIEQLQRNRETMWRQVSLSAADRIRLARERGEGWTNYRGNLWRFRHDRALEIRDHIRDGYDDLFTFDWWRRHRGREFRIGAFSPWWWWHPCAWNALDTFGGFGWGSPIYYDYDANVILDGDYYVDGQDMGSAAAYAQQAFQLANPPAAADEPLPPQADGEAAEWQPLGVFALTQQEKGDAVLFFQLAVNRDGLISGAFTNTLTDETGTVSGSIDRATQRAAWHVGDKTGTAYEAGAANLTQDVSPVLIHFGTQASQTWLLVRMPSPDTPPEQTSAAAPPL